MLALSWSPLGASFVDKHIEESYLSYHFSHSSLISLTSMLACVLLNVSSSSRLIKLLQSIVLLLGLKLTYCLKERNLAQLMHPYLSCALCLLSFAATRSDNSDSASLGNETLLLLAFTSLSFCSLRYHRSRMIGMLAWFLFMTSSWRTAAYLSLLTGVVSMTTDGLSYVMRCGYVHLPHRIDNAVVDEAESRRAERMFSCDGTELIAGMVTLSAASMYLALGAHSEAHIYAFCFSLLTATLRIWILHGVDSAIYRAMFSRFELVYTACNQAFLFYLLPDPTLAQAMIVGSLELWIGVSLHLTRSLQPRHSPARLILIMGASCCRCLRGQPQPTHVMLTAVMVEALVSTIVVHFSRMRRLQSEVLAEANARTARLERDIRDARCGRAAAQQLDLTLSRNFTEVRELIELSLLNHGFTQTYPEKAALLRQASANVLRVIEWTHYREVSPAA